MECGKEGREGRGKAVNEEERRAEEEMKQLNSTCVYWRATRSVEDTRSDLFGKSCK